MEFVRLLIVSMVAFVLSLIPQKTYTEGFVGQPDSFLPTEVAKEEDKIVSRFAFRGLFTYDENGGIVNDLADDYKISGDGLEYTVYLKKNQKWSNGTEITADDLLYSAFNSDQLKEIATDKIDKYTIKYTLPNKYSPFLNLLAAGVSPAITKINKLNPISSGPYKVIKIKREGPIVREVVLQRIDNKYKLPRVSFRYYASEEQLFTAFKLGEVDGFISSADLQWPNLNQWIFYQRGIYYSLIFNLRNEKFKEVDFRKKLFSATPVDEIISGVGIPTLGPISESPYTKTELKYSIYNKELAEDLKKEISITLPDTTEHLKTGEIVKNAWKKLGIEVTLVKLDPKKIEEEIVPERNFEILLYGQEVSRDPDRYVYWHSTKLDAPGLNLSGLENVRLDKSLEEGRKTIGFDDRKKHYTIFQDALYENIPVIFLYHPSLKFYYSKRVKISPDVHLHYNRDRFINFKNWDLN